MFLVNLTLVQLLAIAGGLSLGVIALYLWDRSRRRVVVPTLRFWTASLRPAEVKHRRRIQQPWSLLLQLLGIVLLLLAVAQLRLGERAAAARDHVLVLDTSSWMAARSRGRSLMEVAQAYARAYVRSMAPGDRAMLVRADALATPATAFETNRAVLEQAVLASRPGSTALNLEQAFEFARQARRLHGGRAGEVVYIGPGRTAQASAAAAPGHSDLRILPVEAPVANCGLRAIGARRSASDPDVWEIFVTLQNYGTEPRPARLMLAFGGSPAGTRDLRVPPGGVETVPFQYRSRVGGWLEARVAPGDDFGGNHRAVIELPARRILRVAVYTAEPELLKPVLSSTPEVEPVFRTPAQYGTVESPDLVILDRYSPPAPPAVDSIWIEPPDRSPVRVRALATDAALTRWRSDHPLGAGLRTRDVKLQSAQLFYAADGDVVIAETEGGAVAVGRAGKPKLVVLGFHPMRTQMRFELATPLLFANIIRWMQPEMFRRREINAGSVGAVQVALGAEAEKGDVQVVSEDGSPLPHTRQGGFVRLFAGTPGKVRIVTNEGESVHSLVLPELGEAAWTAPKQARRGLPGGAPAGPNFTELWPWLAVAGALALLGEWLLYGRSRAAALQRRAAAPVRSSAKRGRWRSLLAGVRGLL